MSEAPRIFVSYRRSCRGDVEPVVLALRTAGADVFLDVDDIGPLEPFPERIRQAIASSHAMLLWWSHDYGNSEICLQELRIGWQHARRRGEDVGSRIWPLNPESAAHHIFAGELGAMNYLAAPSAAELDGFCRDLVRRASLLLPAGPLAQVADGIVNVMRAGVPRLGPHFVGRQRELWRIHTALHPVLVGGAARAAAVQLHGPPGLGKTDLAAAYAEHFAAAFPGGVFWLDLAGTVRGDMSQREAEAAWLEALKVALSGDHGWLTPPAGLLLNGPDGEPRSLNDVKAELQLRLGERSSLWVIDNVTTLRPERLRESIVSAWSGPGTLARTLITTRDGLSLKGFSAVEVQTMPEDDALQLLALFRKPTEADAVHSAGLVREVGAHTLALTLLGHRLAAPGASYAELLSGLIQKGRVPRIEDIAARLRPQLGDRAAGILATFATSIEPLGAPAKRLLCLAGHCATNLPIPEKLLTDAYRLLPDAPQDEIDLNDEVQLALAELVNGGLLNRRRDQGQVIEVHPLVADAAPGLTQLSGVEWNHLLAKPLLVELNAGRDRTLDCDEREREKRERDLAALLPHALQVAARRGGQRDEEAGIALLSGVWKFHFDRASYVLARQLAQEALVRSIEIHGPDADETLPVWANFANTLTKLGEFEGAVQIQEFVLDRRKKRDGDSHSSTLRAAHNLAESYNQLNELERACELQRWIHECRQQENNADTARAANNLAGTLVKLNQLQEAESLHRRAWSRRRELLGEEHRETLTSRSNLADTLLRSGNLESAREHFNGVLIKASSINERDPLVSVAALNLFDLGGPGHEPEAQRIFDAHVAWLIDCDPASLGFEQSHVQRELQQRMSRPIPGTSE